ALAQTGASLRALRRAGLGPYARLAPGGAPPRRHGVPDLLRRPRRGQPLQHRVGGGGSRHGDGAAGGRGAGAGARAAGLLRRPRRVPRLGGGARGGAVPVLRGMEPRAHAPAVLRFGGAGGQRRRGAQLPQGLAGSHPGAQPVRSLPRHLALRHERRRAVADVVRVRVPLGARRRRAALVLPREVRRIGRRDRVAPRRARGHRAQAGRAQRGPPLRSPGGRRVPDVVLVRLGGGVPDRLRRVGGRHGLDPARRRGGHRPLHRRMGRRGAGLPLGGGGGWRASHALQRQRVRAHRLRPGAPGAGPV
ncbi:MAG: GH117, partial [uncultured Gemmatimonadetes bacterium]